MKSCLSSHIQEQLYVHKPLHNRYVLIHKLTFKVTISVIFIENK